MTNIVSLALSPWTLAFFFAVGFVGACKAIYDLITKDAPGDIFTRPSQRPRSNQIARLPSTLRLVPSPDGEEPIPMMQGDILWTALDKIVSYAREQKPDVLLGVHLAGRILSCYVAEQIGIIPENCIYVSSRTGPTAGFEFDDRGQKLNGTALIIDDISRSGGTLRELRAYIRQSNEIGTTEFSHVLFAVLVLGASAEEIDKNYLQDFVSYRANSDRCNFPWTIPLLDLRHAWEGIAKGRYDAEGINTYNAIRYDFAAALRMFYETTGPRPKATRRVMIR